MSTGVISALGEPEPITTPPTLNVTVSPSSYLKVPSESVVPVSPPETYLIPATALSLKLPDLTETVGVIFGGMSVSEDIAKLRSESSIV